MFTRTNRNIQINSQSCVDYIANLRFNCLLSKWLISTTTIDSVIGRFCYLMFLTIYGI